MAALSSIAMGVMAAAAAASAGMAASQAMEGTPDAPDMPEAPPPPAPTPEMELPDPLNPVKKKQKQATLLKSSRGGSADTILSDSLKLGG